MTLETILDRAKLIKLPITKNEFKKTRETPLPELPYMIYLIPDTMGRGADSINNIIEQQVALELYTNKTADEDLERQIEETVLFDIEYKKYQAIIQQEEMTQTAYQFMLIYKAGKR